MERVYLLYIYEGEREKIDLKFRSRGKEIFARELVCANGVRSRYIFSRSLFIIQAEMYASSSTHGVWYTFDMTRIRPGCEQVERRRIKGSELARGLIFKRLSRRIIYTSFLFSRIIRDYRARRKSVYLARLHFFSPLPPPSPPPLPSPIFFLFEETALKNYRP